VSNRIIFKDYIPPAEVSSHLKQAKVAISLWAGLKLTDYFSHGLPIVACGNPGKGILRDNDNCILFQPKDPKSLANAINKILDNPALADTLARNAYKTAQEYSWQKRAEKIINFIENNIERQR
ncbi:MAG TPA: glycosyltransferase family 4 protein, partial [Candidatus Brocadiaceae bacterium]